MEKFDRDRQATYDDTVLRRKCAICMAGDEGENADTDSQYLMIFALPRQKWSRLGASMLLSRVHCVLVTMLQLRCTVITDRFKVAKFCDLSGCYLKMFYHLHNLVVKARKVVCIVFQDCQLHASAIT